ncbi:MAG TPA: hypothetical protein PLK82_02335 [Bacteroidales bacterium]|nr:hypothetical protein [Bacteroidales bacterium]
MVEEETIHLYEAIKEMRRLTQLGKSFTFVHSTWNRDTCVSNGFRTVNSARLRPAAKGDDLSNADFKIFYIDEDLNEPRNCWQMLIMFFNGKRVFLN